MKREKKKEAFLFFLSVFLVFIWVETITTQKRNAKTLTKKEEGGWQREMRFE